MLMTSGAKPQFLLQVSCAYWINLLKCVFQLSSSLQAQLLTNLLYFAGFYDVTCFHIMHVHCAVSVMFVTSIVAQKTYIVIVIISFNSSCQVVVVCYCLI